MTVLSTLTEDVSHPVAAVVCAVTTGYTYFHQDRHALLDSQVDEVD